ncbi:MAG: recombination protein RecR, partial [Zetaproteobacteria bacterium]
MNMQGLPPALLQATEALASLPGVGPKTALRMALAILARGPEEAEMLARAIEALPRRVRFCERCFGFAEGALCAICADANRDAGLLCVVEQPVDVLLMERTGQFRGVYHVLHGRLSPVDGVGPERLRIAALDARISRSSIRELILATSATVDGEATAHFLARRYRDRVPKISRIA